MVLPSHTSLRPLPFAFLMTLPSIQFPNMFQHRFHDHLGSNVRFCVSLYKFSHFPPLSWVWVVTSIQSVQFSILKCLYGMLTENICVNDLLCMFAKTGNTVFWVPQQVDSTGFAFIYMEDERDAEDAIRRLDRIEFGRKGRRLRVEWTKQERGGRRPGSPRRSSANTRPSKTLFVINFDPINTRPKDIERHFDPYGTISNVRIRRNFAFVQFELQEDASRALEATHMSTLMDRVISVEYAIRDDDDRRNGYSPDRRGRDMSPDRRDHGRGRSPSPYRRDRGSPDYGHGSVPGSRTEGRGSPDYGRAESPVNERYHSRSPPPRERSRS